jgi:hypothetical protein
VRNKERSIVATLIEFSGGQRTLSVAEDTEAVFEKFVAAEGRPFQLERHGGERVFVNPHAVAFWHHNTETISPGSMLAR